MGCGSAVPTKTIDTPGDGPCSFIVKQSSVSSTFSVCSGDGNDQWLQIVSKCNWLQPKSEIFLKTYKDEDLVKVNIEGEPPVIKVTDEYPGDSDDSEYSADGLFKSENSSSQVKLKWKVTRHATFIGKDGKAFATLSVKVKGKSNGQRRVETVQNSQDTGTADSSRTTFVSEVKAKKVVYKLIMHDKQVALTFDNKTWYAEDRQWSCDFFDVQYVAGLVSDELKVESKGVCPGNNALAVAFVVGSFFHPATYPSLIKSLSDQEAVRFMDK